MSPIDFRSDTITQPTDAMREAMAGAAVGDDVLGHDPTVQALEERVANLLGKDAAIFVPSGTMANLLAVRSQTQPGDEIIAHHDCHIFQYETGGFAAIAGCSMWQLHGERGMFSAEDIRPAVRYDDHHCPRTRLVCVENTANRGGGFCWDLRELRRVKDTSEELGLLVHMDGARVWNAHIATGVPLIELGACADTVSCCFSKGLGAPVGSALAGSAETIARARHFRKMLGGSMRQSGVLGAAALYALDHHVERLADDHANARRLAAGLDRLPGLGVDAQEVQTNLVYVDVGPELGDAFRLQERLEAAGVLSLAETTTRLRFVTHLHLSDADIDGAIERVSGAIGS